MLKRLLLSTALLASIAPAAHADTLVFPGPGGTTYQQTKSEMSNYTRRGTRIYYGAGGGESGTATGGPVDGYSNRN